MEITFRPVESEASETHRNAAEVSADSLPDAATKTIPNPVSEASSSAGDTGLYSVQDFGTIPWVFLDELIASYCKLEEPKILDTTVNQGRIWGRGKSRYKYTGMDIDPKVKPDIVCDHTNMPFPDKCWDILVFDPPHVGEQSKSRFAAVYGTGVPVAKDGGLKHTYPAFLKEAHRVLRVGGILVAKLADCTHRNKFHFASAEFYFAAKLHGFVLQGNHLLPRKNVIVDPKWKHAYHPRQNHSTFLVFKRT